MPEFPMVCLGILLVSGIFHTNIIDNDLCDSSKLRRHIFLFHVQLLPWQYYDFIYCDDTVLECGHWLSAVLHSVKKRDKKIFLAKGHFG